MADADIGENEEIELRELEEMEDEEEIGGTEETNLDDLEWDPTELSKASRASSSSNPSTVTPDLGPPPNKPSGSKRIFTRDRKIFLKNALNVSLNKGDGPNSTTLFDNLQLSNDQQSGKNNGARFKGVKIIVVKDGRYEYSTNSNRETTQAIAEFKATLEKAKAEHAKTAIGETEKQFAEADVTDISEEDVISVLDNIEDQLSEIFEELESEVLEVRKGGLTHAEVDELIGVVAFDRTGNMSPTDQIKTLTEVEIPFWKEKLKGAEKDSVRSKQISRGNTYIIRGPGPTAAKSKIGYLLSGPIATPPSTSSTINASILTVISSTKPDNKALERFWNLESIGILPNETEANKTQTVSEYQNSSIRLENNQNCAKLPWKDNHPPLPTNQSIARGRTRSTVRRLSKEPSMLAAYNKIIQEQLQHGFIEKVANPQSTKGRVHYIPHHAVLKDSSTTPLRTVYDCSCSPNAAQPSLNSCLSTGPDILNDMTAILVCFRCYQYGIAADIEKAFLTISLDEQDRDATRFFWISDPTDPESQFEVYCFKSILFGATCSPFILNASIQKHLDQFNDPVTQRKKSDIYVDNLASGTDNEDEATTFLNQARTIMTPVEFNLRSWDSNSSKVKALATERNIQDTEFQVYVGTPKTTCLNFNHKKKQMTTQTWAKQRRETCYENLLKFTTHLVFFRR